MTFILFASRDIIPISVRTAHQKEKTVCIIRLTGTLVGIYDQRHIHLHLHKVDHFSDRHKQSLQLLDAFHPVVWDLDYNHVNNCILDSCNLLR